MRLDRLLLLSSYLLLVLVVAGMAFFVENQFNDARDDAVEDRCAAVGVSLDLFYLTGLNALDDPVAIQQFDADFQDLVTEVEAVVCK